MITVSISTTDEKQVIRLKHKVVQVYTTLKNVSEQWNYPP